MLTEKRTTVDESEIINYYHNGRCDLTNFYCDGSQYKGRCNGCEIKLEIEQASAEELYEVK